VSSGLKRCGESGLVLRTKEALYESERVFKGRGGVRRHTRPYHLFVLRRDGSDNVFIAGRVCRYESNIKPLRLLSVP
ncbi:MAG: hypothetical protein ACE5IF_04085, partial [Candidatus Bathyarchaeia archaeon]